MSTPLEKSTAPLSVSWKKSLGFRLMMILVGLSFFIGIVMMIFLSIIYQGRLDSEYTSKAVMLSKIAASMVDGEAVDRYLLTLEKDDDYQRILAQLQVQLRESNASYIYISRVVGREEFIVFDAEEADAEVDLGFVISLEDESFDDVLAAYERGEWVEPFIVDTEWGRLFTSVEPILRADGSIAAHAYAAISIDQILEERAFVFTLLGLIILLTCSAFVMASFFAVRKLVISPVRTLVDGVSAYHPGEALPDLFDPEKPKPLSHSSNEIAVLEQSITEMAARTESMFAEVKQLEAVRLSNRAKSEFLARMSHEIRTPMNTILGISQIQLQQNNLPDAATTAWKHVYGAGNTLLAIINDILDMSKIETGKMELHPLDYSLPSLINDAVTLNIVQIGSRPIEFYIELEEDLPLWLRGDELRLKEVLTNLLSNAIKYTDKGSVRLSVSHLRENGEVMLRFVVEDTGYGIKPEDMPKLFAEFTRLDVVSATRHIEGTGLGLSIAKKLVEMMGGAIEVESTYGVGSKFTATVRQQTINDEVIDKNLAEQIRNFTFAADKQFQRVQIVHYPMPYGKALIVDDVRSNLFVAEGLMLPYDLQVETATSGYSAINKIEAGNAYDIIFMDHMMPQMDGIETTKKLREMGYQGAIVALTANALLGNDVMFRENGFDDFLPKPIDIRYLNVLLNKFVRDKYPEEAAKYKLKVKAEQQASQSEAHQQLLALFLSDAEDALVALRGALESGDTKLYTTTVHAMKSALRNIGKDALAETAAALESAGRAGDTPFIAAQHQHFVESLEALVNRLSVVAAAEDDDREIEEDTAYLTEQCRLIKEACENYDDAAVYAALDRLKEKQWKAKTTVALSEMRDMLFFDSDFESVAARVQQLER